MEFRMLGPEVLRGRLPLAEAATGANRKADAAAVVPEIVSRSHTHQLSAPADSGDRFRFQRLTAASSAEPDDPAVRLPLGADARWQGWALSGPPGLWAETVRRSLSGIRLAATVSRTAAWPRLGQNAPPIGELPALVQGPTAPDPGPSPVRAQTSAPAHTPPDDRPSVPRTLPHQCPLLGCRAASPRRPARCRGDAVRMPPLPTFGP